MTIDRNFFKGSTLALNIQEAFRKLCDIIDGGSLTIVGVTSSADELNILDGVTATAAQVNAAPPFQY